MSFDYTVFFLLSVFPLIQILFGGCYVVVRKPLQRHIKYLFGWDEKKFFDTQTWEALVNKFGSSLPNLDGFGRSAIQVTGWWLLVSGITMMRDASSMLFWKKTQYTWPGMFWYSCVMAVSTAMLWKLTTETRGPRHLLAGSFAVSFTAYMIFLSEWQPASHVLAGICLGAGLLAGWAGRLRIK